jgi:23S rRNA (uracil1939-C5)-methyltransferase
LTQYFQRHHLTAYDETSAQGFFRYILLRSVPTKDGQIERMVCLILNEKLFSKGKLKYHLPNEEKLIQALTAIEGMKSITLCENRQPGNNMMGDQVKAIWGRESLRAFISLPKQKNERAREIGFEFILSPNSFLQVNTIQMQYLYRMILSYASLTKDDVVIDLYCGIGTFSLFLAQAAKWVYGIEQSPQAIDDAKQNASLNHTMNTSFYAGKVEEILPVIYQEEGLHPDVIVLDPPRKGCEEAALQTIIEMNPKKILYVSCDPATLARDVRFLADSGYRIQRYRPFDMFPQTVHVETVVLMVNNHKEVEL